MPGGYAGQYLRVDLSKGIIEKLPMPDERILRKYVGGIGLGIYWLLQADIPPDMKASDPAVPLLFMTGPLSGTPAPNSSNLAMVSLNFDVPYAVATAHTHGFWAAYLKHAGYDAVYVVGRAESPVYLWIDGEHVEIRNARHIWGQDTRETERLIKRELGDEEMISVACIGPAGEKMLHGAVIRNDRNHGANKGSTGAIMGSKQLKAIAVRGSSEVRLMDREGFLDAVDPWRKAIFEGGIKPSTRLRDGGMMRTYIYAGKKNLIAAKNFTDPVWGEKATERIVEAAKGWVITPQASYNCEIKCSYDCHITSGPFAGVTASMCGGGENIEGSSLLMGVEEPGAAMALTEAMDALGIDSSVTGALIAAAFELYNKGQLTKDDTGGLDLSWGNYESIFTLLEQMIQGEGFGGKILTKSLKEGARLLGRGAETCVIHIRGAGMNLHDWRPHWGNILGQVLSSGAGVCHSGPGADSHTEPDLGYPTFMVGPTADGKAEAVAKTQAKKLWEDTLGICWFACWGVEGVLNDYAPRALGKATGWLDFNREEALTVGRRVAAMQRVMAMRRGFTKQDEFDISERVLEAPPNGIGMGKSIRPYLSGLVDEYYQLMGYDLATGHPTFTTLKQLGLENLMR